MDPVSGWLIYYIGTGVLLTPSKKCIGGGGRPVTWLERTWRNVLALVTPPPAAPPRPRVTVAPTPTAEAPAAPTPSPPAPSAARLCLDPRIWPLAWRPQAGPCVPPQIEYPGT